MLSKNNASRKIFKDFLENNNLSKIDSRNVFNFGDKRYAFCITDNMDDKILCRQFYDDCTDVISLNIITNKLHEVSKYNCKIDTSPNRITTKGLHAYSAKSHLSNAKESEFILG